METPSTKEKPRQGSIPSVELPDHLTTADTTTPPETSPPRDHTSNFHSPFNEWSLILTEISALLDNVAETFDNINSDDVMEEVVASGDGQSFLDNLLEVYKVYRRIQMSLRLTGKMEKRGQLLLDQTEEIEKCWQRLAMKVRPVDERSQSLDFPTRYHLD